MDQGRRGLDGGRRRDVVIGNPNPKYDKLKKQHWAWQPLKVAKPPAVRDASWPRSSIDQFVLAKLENAGAQTESRRRQARLDTAHHVRPYRLPPTLEEIDAFVADNTFEAFEQVVDRLLASPVFGERWGRHWLDVARYGESTGSSRNLPNAPRLALSRLRHRRVHAR